MLIVVLSESVKPLSPDMFREDPQSTFMVLKYICQHIFLQWFVNIAQHKEQKFLCI